MTNRENRQDRYLVVISRICIFFIYQEFIETLYSSWRYFKVHYKLSEFDTVNHWYIHLIYRI